MGAAGAALVPKGSKSTWGGDAEAEADATAAGGEALKISPGGAAVGEGACCAALPPVNPALPPVNPALPPVKPALPPVNPALPPVTPAPPFASKVAAAGACCGGGACCEGLGVLRLIPPRRSDTGSAAAGGGAGAAACCGDGAGPFPSAGAFLTYSSMVCRKDPGGFSTAGNFSDRNAIQFSSALRYIRDKSSPCVIDFLYISSAFAA